MTSFSQVKPDTWLISYTVAASGCFSKVRKSFNSIWQEVVVLFRAAATAETKRQDWLCRWVQPTEREICGSGLFESKGIISFHSHRLNLGFSRCTLRKIVLLEVLIRHSVSNLNLVLYPADGEKGSHLQNRIQRDKVVWRRRSGKSLGSFGFFLSYTFALSCKRCLIL